jgi:uncharacterized membrane protein YhiD involved in acid resistance
MPERSLPVALSDFSASLPDLVDENLAVVVRALVALPLAAGLGTALAFRPRRRATPAHSAAVIQTQIVLAIVGAMVMLVVGASLARAFGIVGAASWIRYRAKIEDPKDAVVMLSTLGIGLATGVELHALALLGTLFTLAVMFALESLEPGRRNRFELRLTTVDPEAVRSDVEAVLRSCDVRHEVRRAGAKELVYEAHVPVELAPGRVSAAIRQFVADDETEVVWEVK